ncbi:MAG: cytochrome c biogenesis protein CcsA [Acidobacteriia bacterium]|nr:cytochrome c biogenesis protein CcsA [Terriglobia bacterium]
MAKVASTQIVDRREASPASWILMVVAVAVATVLAVSLPRLIQPAGWMSGEKFLYLALIAYLGASALYIASLAVRPRFTSSGLAGAAALARGGFLVHTTGVAVRWAAAGHAPFSNIYEMVLMFSWGVVALQLLAEWKMRVKYFGAITLPVAALALVLMQVLPGEIRPLVPALQSTWLQIHVTLAIFSYAGFTLSFAAALLYFLKDGTSPRTFLNWAAGLVTGIYGVIVLAAVDRGVNLLLPAWDLATSQKIMLGPKQPLMVPVSGLGWPVVIALALAGLALASNVASTLGRRPGPVGIWAASFFRAALFAQATSVVLLVLKGNSGPYVVPEIGKDVVVRLASSPFLLSGLVTALFISLAWEVLNWKHDAIVEYLPQRETLDNLIYKTVAISFPLLTLMIIAGAYWANRTWGSYWSWDPKEDWALITWLTYAGYLHMRQTRGWRGRRAAYMAIIGFAIVMFTFFGVTYLLPGLHAYA